MKISVVLASTLLVDARKVRTPAERQSKNSDFLMKWFSHNCKGEEYRDVDVDAVRPFRCQNKFDRYMKEWEKLEAYFNMCGHFDLEAATAAAQGRKRRDYDSDDYAEEWAAFEAEGDEGLFDNDLWELSDEDLDEMDKDDQNDSGRKDLDSLNYFAYFEEFKEDYKDYYLPSDSTTDEDNAQARTAADLRPQEYRALSADPSRSLRQLGNAMKQYVKKFLPDCPNSEKSLRRLTQVYREAKKLHEFVMEKIAEKYARMEERAQRRRNRL